MVLYCGAHGISHALGRILDVADRLRADSRVHFLLVGEGAEKDALVAARASARSHERDVPARRAAGARSRRSTAARTLCLVPLRAVPLFRAFIPSKMFEILACGRPILASLEGEAAEILRESGAAVVVPPEDVEALVAAVRRLAADPDTCARARRRAAGRTWPPTSTATPSALATSVSSTACRAVRRGRYNRGSPAPRGSPCPFPSFKSRRLKVLHVVGARPNFMKVAPVMLPSCL